MLTAAVLCGLLLLLGFSIGQAQDRLVVSLRVLPSAVKRWGGWALLIVGGWLLMTALWADAFATWLLG